MLRSLGFFVVFAALSVTGTACSSSESKPDKPKDSATVVVGPTGGTVSAESGVSVAVPAGAVDSDVEITVGAVAVSDLAATVPAGTTLRGSPHRFLPHGTAFNLPVTIRLPYTGAANVVLRLDNEADTSWESVSQVSFNGGVASFETTRFSIYAPAEQAGPYCPSPSTGPVGSVTFTGGSFAAVDAVGIITYQTNAASEGGSIPFRSQLDIRLTDYANPWGFEAMELFKQGGRWFHLTIDEPSQTDFPGLPEPGTYALSQQLPIPWDIPSLRAAGELYDGGECLTTGSLGGGPESGIVTLTAVSDAEISGSFSLVRADQSTVSGTFTAPLVTRTVPEGELCCWTPDGGIPPPVTIGAAGGEVISGAAKLSVPSGALSTDVEISIKPIALSALAASLPSRTVLTGTPYGISPYATTFLSPATITLPVAGPGNRVLRLDDELDGFWTEVTSPSFAAGSVQFAVDSLGVFAVAAYSLPVCEPPSATAPTGTVSAGGTFSGGLAWSAVDTVALFNQYQILGGESPAYLTILNIWFTSFPSACGLEEAGWVVPGGQVFSLSVHERSMTTWPEMPPVGVYPFTEDTTPVFDTPQFVFANSGGGGDFGDECAYITPAPTAGASGSLTLTATSSTEVQGTFTFTDGDGGSHSGTFTAPVCQSLGTGCCYSP